MVPVNIVWSTDSNYSKSEKETFVETWLSSTQEEFQREFGVLLVPIGIGTDGIPGKNGQAYDLHSNDRQIDPKNMADRALNVYVTEATLHDKLPVGGATEYKDRSVFVRYNVTGQNRTTLTHEFLHAFGISGDARNGYTSGPNGTAEQTVQRVTSYITSSTFRSRSYDKTLIRTQIRQGVRRLGGI